MIGKFRSFVGTVLFATMFGAGSAVADYTCTPNADRTYNTVNSGECSSSERISNSDATCMTATWSTTYNAAEAGYRITAVNECSDLGNIEIHMDLTAVSDAMACVGSRRFFRYASGVPRKVTCCLDDEGDLCIRHQVEDKNGKIYHAVYPNYVWVDVGTHQKRYDFCQDNPDYVYCQVDPSGDASVNPTTMTGDCDGSPCTIQDCRDNFADSPAADSPSSCKSGSELSLRYPDWPGDPSRNYDNRPDNEWTVPNDECYFRHTECTSNAGNTITADFLDIASNATTWDVGTDYIAVDAADMDELRYCEKRRNPNQSIMVYRIVHGSCPDGWSASSSSN